MFQNTFPSSAADGDAGAGLLERAGTVGSLVDKANLVQLHAADKHSPRKMYKSVCGNFFLTEQQIAQMRSTVEQKKRAMDEHFSLHGSQISELGKSFYGDYQSNRSAGGARNSLSNSKQYRQRFSSNHIHDKDLASTQAQASRFAQKVEVPQLG